MTTELGRAPSDVYLPRCHCWTCSTSCHSFPPQLRQLQLEEQRDTFDRHLFPLVIAFEDEARIGFSRTCLSRFEVPEHSWC